MFVPGKPFQPSLMFAGKVGAYPSEAFSGAPLWGSLLESKIFVTSQMIHSAECWYAERCYAECCGTLDHRFEVLVHVMIQRQSVIMKFFILGSIFCKKISIICSY